MTKASDIQVPDMPLGMDCEPLPFPSDETERESLIERLVEQGEDDGRPWCIADKGAASWAVRKVAEARAAQAENRRIHEAERARIDRWLERENERLERGILFFQLHLERWHREQLERDPKAKTIRFPHGESHLRAQQPEMVYEETQLLGWLKEHQPDLVRVKEEPNRAELRKVVELVPSDVTGRFHLILKETGEVVGGAYALERPSAYSVKTDEGVR